MKIQYHLGRPGFAAFRLLILVILLFASSTGLSVQAGTETAAISTKSSALSTERTIRFPANALNYDKTSTILTQAATGIRWQSDFQAGAYLTMPRPHDWDGVSDVTMHLYFYPTTGTSGNVQFFIRPRAFDPGDTFADASSLSGDVVAVASANQVQEQTITIPAARFGAKELWVITIQREGSLETYTDDVILTSVGLSYMALSAPPTSAGLGLPANALNYDKTSTILTQDATGIRWQSDFLNPAYLIVPRPQDWDGVSDVTMHLYFTTTTATSGNVQFFIRPRAYDPGDTFADASSLSGDVVAVSGANQVQEQTITIPAASFGAKELWVITIQREGSLETYADDVILMSAALSYTPQPPAAPITGQPSSFGYPANALNYDKTSTILTQAATGIRWQSDFLNPAYLIVPRPQDWDGVSDVTMHLYFTTTTATSGNVQFFIRPRAYDPGDTFADASSLSGDVVAVASANQVQEQTITIPAARFGAKELWVITIQREGSLETYTDDVILTSVSLSYTQQFIGNYLPVIFK